VDVAHDLGPGDGEEVDVALELSGVILESPSPVVLLGEPVALDHGPHRAIQEQDALFQQGPEPGYPGLPLLADSSIENHNTLS
jgi:hypothetical protein